MRATVRPLRFALAVLIALSPLGVAGQGQDSPEARFRASIVPANIRENMRRLSARPHHVGSPYDKDNAEWMLARFREWGWDARDRDLRRAVPDAEGARRSRWSRRRRFRAALEEPPVAGDPTSRQTTSSSPTYNAYSIDGDVTAPLVLRELRRARGLRRARSRSASRSRARSSSRGTADRGAASSRRSPPSTARSAA